MSTRSREQSSALRLSTPLRSESKSCTYLLTSDKRSAWRLSSALMVSDKSSGKSARSYVSGSVDIRTSRGFGRSPQLSILKLSQNYKRRQEASRGRIQLISGELACFGRP